MGETYLREYMRTIIYSASVCVEHYGAKTTTNEAKRSKRGARFRRKPRLVDKVAEGLAMGLSGPAPSFAKMGAFVAKQAVKGIKDNVQHYRRRK